MKRWCCWLLLLCSTAWSHPLIKVGGYPYAPFVVKEGDNSYRGLTLDLIAELNEIQRDVRFVFVPTSASHRYQALALGRFSLMLFEDIRWDWNADQVRMTRPLLLGGEIYVALKAPGRDQSFFEHLEQRRLIGVTGYHYGVADFNATPAELKQRFDITLVKDNISALQGVFKGRGEVAMLNLSYLNQFSKQYPQQAARLLRSDKWDQQYELRALLSPTASVSASQLEAWLAALQSSGRLTRLWTKYGVQHQAAP
ncbi:transporter substrate-binding domain-containing protein [Aeromonas bestiarum]|uniref:Transporter substrate-binding domain-containing protein n=1 Tax=Aeromonas bestiarum TaxID=105751 RepID=A0AAW7I2S8_9GAMM|nr:MULTISPECIES: transporter substrate-binding domain-containing protein [Aeromonas]ATM00112.1 ABC transporter substrate-binding protein [Aeromonas sp. CA23]MDM5140451.1 transporter substrate-binding domain-containing protein [Aeromonas bestiarum]